MAFVVHYFCDEILKHNLVRGGYTLVVWSSFLDLRVFEGRWGQTFLQPLANKREKGKNEVSDWRGGPTVIPTREICNQWMSSECNGFALDKKASRVLYAVALVLCSTIWLQHYKLA